MDDLQSILARVLEKRGLRLHANAARITHVATQALAKLLPNAVRFCRVKSFSGGTLLIEVENAVAAQECRSVVEQLQEAVFRASKVRIDEVRIVRQTSGTRP